MRELDQIPDHKVNLLVNGLVSPKQLAEVHAPELQEPTPGTGPSLVVGGLDLGTGRS
jgi:hypothetical protein